MNIFHYEINQNLQKIYYFAEVIFDTYFSFSCEALKSRPLDLLNPQNDPGRINGVVKTSSLFFRRIADVSVYLPSADVLVKADAIVKIYQSRKLSISNVPAVYGMLVFKRRIQSEYFNNNTR